MAQSTILFIEGACGFISYFFTRTVIREIFGVKIFFNSTNTMKKKHTKYVPHAL